MPQATTTAVCGPVETFFDATPQKWQDSSTDQWLDGWWNKNQANITEKGFSKVFGLWALGDETFSCKDTNEAGNCNVMACGNEKMNSLGDETGPAYYVALAVVRYRGFLMGLKETLQLTAISTALKSYSLATDFHEGDFDPATTTDISGMLASVIGVAAAGLSKIPALGPVSVLGSLASFVNAGINMQLNSVSKVAKNAGELQSWMANLLDASMTNFPDRINGLMTGESTEGVGDLRKHLEDGQWVNYTGLDKPDVSPKIRQTMLALAINSLWRQQPVFILGGLSCDNTPQDLGTTDAAFACVDGKKWYIFSWMGTDPGYVDGPLGSKLLGTDNYAGMKVEDAIKSSVQTHSGIGGATDARSNFLLDKVTENPGIWEEGPGLPGIWTLPICDISGNFNTKYKRKEAILAPYGKRPIWCGPICGSTEKTTEFLKQANFEKEAYKDMSWTVSTADDTGCLGGEGDYWYWKDQEPQDPDWDGDYFPGWND